MDIDTRILERLGLHEELLEQGTPVTPEELCQDCSELLGEVQRRIDGLRGMLNAPPEQEAETETGSTDNRSGRTRAAVGTPPFVRVRT